jgi:hypothetical protein
MKAMTIDPRRKIYRISILVQAIITYQPVASNLSTLLILPTVAQAAYQLQIDRPTTGRSLTSSQSMAMSMKASISIRKLAQILGLDLAMDHPNTHLMVHNLPVFI